MAQSSRHACPVCAQPEVQVFLSLNSVPVFCNVLWSSADAARDAPRGDLTLGFCQRCGHVFNTTFHPELMEYGEQYENSLHYSARFQAFAEELAARLIAKHSLNHKTIVEIACGKGDFLRMLCAGGKNRGIGFDPSYEPEREDAAADIAIEVVRDYYGERYADTEADFICCRHALEHVSAPTEFLAGIRRAVGDRRQTALYFEVPNVLYTLRDLGIWDLIYEHPSYFSAGSLHCAFAQAGFTVDEVREEFGGQFLGLAARPAAEVGPGTARPAAVQMTTLQGYVAAFAASYRQKLGHWQQRLAGARRAAKRVVIWGGGSKGVTFLNALEARDVITYVVDVNPNKVGKFVAGTAQRVVAPEFLKEYRPEWIVIMNPIYRDEIAAQAADLGLAAEILTV